MSFILTDADERQLAGVHPDLVKVVRRAAAISEIPFKVLEGVRTLARQRHLKAIGATRTLNSRHLTGHAVDIIPQVDINGDGKLTSNELFDWPLYDRLKVAMKQAAKDVGVPLEWGGDWKQFKDGPHWQLPFRQYPKDGAKTASLLWDGVFSNEVEGEDITNYETEAQAATKAAGAAATSSITAVSIGADPMATLVQNLAAQQYELSSGDITRIVVSLAILGVGFWYAWKKAKSG